MTDLKTLRARLAQEEATLAAAAEQINIAEHQIEAAQAQIEVGRAKIDRLRDHQADVAKRAELLHQYIELAESGENEPSLSDALASPPETIDATLDALPDLMDASPVELIELPVADPSPGSVATDSTLSFETLDKQRLVDQLLPSAETFEEELLILMAFHKKAVRPKEIARIFRAFEYAPQSHAGEDSIKTQLESGTELFERVSGGRYALTDEGRAEADRLLKQLEQ